MLAVGNCTAGTGVVAAFMVESGSDLLRPSNAHVEPQKPLMAWGLSLAFAVVAVHLAGSRGDDSHLLDYQNH